MRRACLAAGTAVVDVGPQVDALTGRAADGEPGGAVTPAHAVRADLSRCAQCAARAAVRVVDAQVDAGSAAVNEGRGAREVGRSEVRDHKVNDARVHRPVAWQPVAAARGQRHDQDRDLRRHSVTIAGSGVRAEAVRRSGCMHMINYRIAFSRLNSFIYATAHLRHNRTRGTQWQTSFPSVSKSWW